MTSLGNDQKRILILTHYFPPEIGAPQARLSEMANHWAIRGHRVTVLTCFPNHPTGQVPEKYKELYQQKRMCQESMGALAVYRCWAYATPNKGFTKKLMGHLSFMVTAVIQGRKVAKQQDVILVSSPTFFSVISAFILSKLYSVPYIFEVRDLWPAIFVELGVLKNRYVISLLEKLEMYLYRKSAAVVTVTDKFSEMIVARGIAKEKVHTIKNGVDLEKYYFREKDVELLENLELSGKFIALYIGAHGISHSLTKLVDAAALLAGEDRIHFLFVGEGAEKEKTVEHCRSQGLNNCTFLPGQPKEKMTVFYSIMDVGLVPLRDIPLFDTFIPSKMFEIMGMEKPIVASVRGEAADILLESGGALVCQPEGSEMIAKNILALYENPQKARELGRHGRVFVEKHYSRAKLADEYMKIISRFNAL